MPENEAEKPEEKPPVDPDQLDMFADQEKPEEDEAADGGPKVKPGQPDYYKELPF